MYSRSKARTVSSHGILRFLGSATQSHRFKCTAPRALHTATRPPCRPCRAVLYPVMSIWSASQLYRHELCESTYTHLCAHVQAPCLARYRLCAARALRIHHHNLIMIKKRYSISEGISESKCTRAVSHAVQHAHMLCTAYCDTQKASTLALSVSARLPTKGAQPRTAHIARLFILTRNSCSVRGGPPSPLHLLQRGPPQAAHRKQRTP